MGNSLRIRWESPQMASVRGLCLTSDKTLIYCIPDKLPYFFLLPYSLSTNCHLYLAGQWPGEGKVDWFKGILVSNDSSLEFIFNHQARTFEQVKPWPCFQIGLKGGILDLQPLLQTSFTVAVDPYYHSSASASVTFNQLLLSLLRLLSLFSFSRSWFMVSHCTN